MSERGASGEYPSFSSQPWPMHDEPLWYVQKGSRIQGPYSANEVGRFLLLGRVRNSDRVSRDGELWEPVTQVPELIPEELLDLDTNQGWQRFLERRALADERDREQVLSPERLAADDEMVELLRREWSRQSAGSSVLPWMLFGLTLVTLAAVLVFEGGLPIAHP